MTEFIGENYLGGDAYSLSSGRNPTQSLRKQIGPEHLAGSRLTARLPIIETGMALGLCGGACRARQRARPSRPRGNRSSQI